MSKKAPKTKQIERQGVALIATRAADLGHLWNETQNDVGIDGWLELVRRPAREATGRIILVQSKATGVAFASDAPITYVCREEDLRYWLHGNAPVILVRTHPTSGQAFWVSIKDYFAEHPEHRAARRIVFDRDADRFDASADERLWQLARPRHDGLHLGPPPVRETLTSNLVAVERFPDVIFCAPAAVHTHRQARAALKGLGVPPPRAWTLWGGSVFSFHDPATSHVSRLCAGPAERLAVGDWADSDDRDEQRHFVHLLNGALDEQLRPAARSAKNPHLLFVRSPRDVTTVELPGLGGQTRTVVKPYLREDGSLKYVRHLAMDRRFKRFGDSWYLEILPSYFFSNDGWWESKFAAGYLSGIKRSERHADMRRHVQTWTWILRGEVDLGGLTPDPEHQLLEFGGGLAVEMDTADGDLAAAEDDEERGEEWNAA